jgi:RNA polymerase-binding protein DksA
MSSIDTEGFRERLLEERARARAAIDNLHADHPGSIADESGEASVDTHMGDVATVTFDRELDYTLEDSEEAKLAAVDRALARIDEGTFGTCQNCGQQIAVARLEALPYAELCIDCKRRSER